MSTLDDLALARTTLAGPDLVHVERLASAWRPLADLSFADLLLLAPIEGEEPCHVDTIWPLWNLLDLTPDGRGGEWHPKLRY